MKANQYRIQPGKPVDLDEWDPDDTSGWRKGKEEAEQELSRLRDKLEELQELLYGEHRHCLLVVLQGMDTSGKDGTIKHVFRGVNPQGVAVVRFQPPTQQELDHDYLWRVHPHTPAKGEITIFNRSHYEDVLVVRVHELVAPRVWRRRYRHICESERMLADEGITILKFFLHISRDEQKKRLQERLDDSRKRWKFDLTDIKERKLWPQYMKAYEDALEKTASDLAPWYIVPANRKWYRNLVVSTVIVEALQGLKMKYPKVRINEKQLKLG